MHISKVRSCTLDTWLPEQVQFMARTGNAAANAHYEARLEPSQKPSYYSPELEAFVRRKVSKPCGVNPVIYVDLGNELCLRGWQLLLADRKEQQIHLMSSVLRRI